MVLGFNSGSFRLGTDEYHPTFRQLVPNGSSTWRFPPFGRLLASVSSLRSDNTRQRLSSNAMSAPRGEQHCGDGQKNAHIARFG
jgi:hypothetical protein